MSADIPRLSKMAFHALEYGTSYLSLALCSRFASLNAIKSSNSSSVHCTKEIPSYRKFSKLYSSFSAMTTIVVHHNLQHIRIQYVCQVLYSLLFPTIEIVNVIVIIFVNYLQLT